MVSKKIKILLRILFAKKRNEYVDVLYDYIYKDNVYRFVELGISTRTPYPMYISIGDKKTDMINAEHIGFFALLNNYVLANLVIAENMNLVPFVKWGETTPYFEPNCDNSFLQYFQQISEITEDDIFKSNRVLLSYKKSKNLEHQGKNYLSNEKIIDDYARLYNKYIKLQPHIEKKINDICITNKISERTIGVHIRGVEWGKLENHPIPIKLEQYFAKIDGIIDDYDKIFLATDSEENIVAFIEKYGEERVVYNNVARTPAGSQQLVIFDSSVANKFNLGFEVLLDMYSLSYCGSIIAGVSNVSFTARYVKRSRGEKYIHEIILNNGIVENGISIAELTKMQKNANRMS